MIWFVAIFSNICLSYVPVDKSGRRLSQIELTRMSLKKTEKAGSDSEDEKVRFWIYDNYYFLIHFFKRNIAGIFVVNLNIFFYLIKIEEHINLIAKFNMFLFFSYSTSICWWLSYKNIFNITLSCRNVQTCLCIDTNRYSKQMCTTNKFLILIYSNAFINKREEK